MSDWAAKRFWTKTSVVADGTGFAVQLDGKPVRTPGKAHLLIPTEPMAQAVADEWEAQQGLIDPGSMPMTRMANSAIEKVRPQEQAVRDHLAEYAQTDLLCYRAERPEALVLRQDAGWDPLLDWARRAHDADLVVTRGVMPVAQPVSAIARLAAPMQEMDAFALTGFHDLVGLSGSFVLALAVSEGQIEPGAAFELSRLDEAWQAELWGEDEEAAETAAFKRAAFLDAARFLCLSRGQSA